MLSNHRFRVWNKKSTIPLIGIFFYDHYARPTTPTKVSNLWVTLRRFVTGIRRVPSSRQFTKPSRCSSMASRHGKRFVPVNSSPVRVSSCLRTFAARIIKFSHRSRRDNSNLIRSRPLPSLLQGPGCIRPVIEPFLGIEWRWKMIGSDDWFCCGATDETAISRERWREERSLDLLGLIVESRINWGRLKCVV